MRVAAEKRALASRRTFYLSVIYGLWGAMGMALAVPSLIYLLFPPKTKKEPEWVEAGDGGGLEPNQPVEMVFRRNRVDGWKVMSEKSTAWVVKLPGGDVVAFRPQCTHLGCAYHWDAGRNEFVCPCHSSVFAVDGRVLAGPAPRPLDRYPVKLENGKLLVGPLAAGTKA